MDLSSSTMASTTTASELVTLMRPWLRVLKKATDVIDLPSDPSEIVYIHVETFNDGFGQTIQPDPRALEALHLLTFLSEIDHAAWMQAVRIAWPTHADGIVRLSAGKVLQLGVRLGFNHDVMDEEICPIEDWYADLLACAAPPTGSTKYEQTLRVFEAAYAAAERDSSRTTKKREDLELPVRIVLFQGPYEARLQMLAVLARDDELRQTPVPVAAPGILPNVSEWKPLLRIAEVCPGILEDTAFTVEHLEMLASLVEFGADVDDFSFGGFAYTEASAATVAQALQQLMRTPTKRTQGQSRTPITRTAVNRRLSRHALQAIFSALQTSQSVTKIDVNRDVPGRAPPTSQGDRSFAWRNIVYALFGPASTHQISKVTMFLDDLCMEDVDAVREMVQHRDPLAVLLGRDQVESSDSVEFVTASKFCSAAHGFSVVELEPQEVRVLKENNGMVSGMVSVYLPGRGQAWVLASDCSNRRSEPAVGGFGSREIDSVDITWMSNASKDAVLALLRLVGSGIKNLAFEALVGEFDPMDDWFAGLLEACPRLEKLTFGGKLHSLDTIVNAFHSSLRQLKTLNLKNLDLVDPSSASGFFRSFADSEHPMTQRLRNFRVYSSQWDVSPEDLFSTLKDVISTNRRLLSFNVGLSLPDPKKYGDLARFKFEEIGITPISERELELSADQKLAFLSVTSSDQTPSVASNVDSHVAPLIFDFAAECRKRRVFISFDNWFNRY